MKSNNVIDEAKKNYILKMRGVLCDDDLVKKDKANFLNLPYFSVKKGQYWNSDATKLLKETMLEYGVDFQAIRDNVFN